jgi:peptidoglycan L-alanyl-D-glutamate endopeptidase CwlK
MSKSLDDLTPTFKVKVEQLIKNLKDLGITVIVVDTLRTIAEQKQNIKKGVSWTMNSKHLPGPDGKARAIDIVPHVLAIKKNWAPESPLWKTVGEEAKKLGLKWGGDWKQKDLVHIEL